MNNKNLSKKWLYTFIIIAIARPCHRVVGLYNKEYIIAIGTGLVFGVQVFNIIKWKRN